MFDAKFIKKEKVAKDIYSFYFQPDSPVRFVAGQFTELKLTHKNPDNRGEKRWFTISSSPENKLLAITTKITPEKSTFKQALSRLESGAKIQMANPMGDFVLPKDRSLPLLFVGGGVGCTPFHSIIQHLNQAHEKRDIKFIYSANNLEDVAFKDTFESLRDGFEIALTNPPDNWGGKSGRITAKDILKASNSGQRRTYISGPEPMVETLDKELKDAGVPKHQILGDFFPGYQTI